MRDLAASQTQYAIFPNHLTNALTKGKSGHLRTGANGASAGTERPRPGGYSGGSVPPTDSVRVVVVRGTFVCGVVVLMRGRRGVEFAGPVLVFRHHTVVPVRVIVLMSVLMDMRMRVRVRVMQIAMPMPVVMRVRMFMLVRMPVLVRMCRTNIGGGLVVWHVDPFCASERFAGQIIQRHG